MAENLTLPGHLPHRLPDTRRRALEPKGERSSGLGLTEVVAKTVGADGLTQAQK